MGIVFPEYKTLLNLCLKYSTCDLYCMCAKSGRCRNILLMCVPACVHSVDKWASRTRCRSYMAVFTIKVIEIAENNTNHSAEREFDVNEKQI